MKEVTKVVCGWDELVKFVDSVNPYKKTLVLSGWVCEEASDGSFRIKKLVFSTKNVGILKEKNSNSSPKK